VISKIIAVVGVIKELITLIRMLLAWIEQTKEAEAAKRSEERKKAIEDLKNARTVEEAYEAQERIINNKP